MAYYFDQEVMSKYDYYGDPFVDVKAKLNGILTVIRASPAVKPVNVMIEKWYSLRRRQVFRKINYWRKADI